MKFEINTNPDAVWEVFDLIKDTMKAHLAENTAERSRVVAEIECAEERGEDTTSLEEELLALRIQYAGVDEMYSKIKDAYMEAYDNTFCGGEEE